MNDAARHAKAITTRKNCVRAAGRASAIRRESPDAAPASGNVPWVMATSSARINAK